MMKLRRTTTMTLTPDPDQVVSIAAAHELKKLGLPANGAFLAAAEALKERGEDINKASLCVALHEGSLRVALHEA